jgi:hypothetical protein
LSIKDRLELSLFNQSQAGADDVPTAPITMLCKLANNVPAPIAAAPIIRGNPVIHQIFYFPDRLKYLARCFTLCQIFAPLPDVLFLKQSGRYFPKIKYLAHVFKYYARCLKIDVRSLNFPNIWFINTRHRKAHPDVVEGKGTRCVRYSVLFAVLSC